MAQIYRDKASYSSKFESFHARDAKSAPAWLRKIRQEGFRKFEALGFPTRAHEDWKYTNVSDIGKLEFFPALFSDSFGPNGSPDIPPHDALNDPLSTPFINGYCQFGKGLTGGLSSGAQITDLASGIMEIPELLEANLTTSLANKDNGFVALNTAFIRHGAFVHVPKGVKVVDPIILSFNPLSQNRPITYCPRNLIVVEEESEAIVVEKYLGSDASYFTNTVTEIFLRPGAHLYYYKIQLEGSRCYHISNTTAVLGNNSNFSSLYLDLGSKLARNDLNVMFSGEGASCMLNGLYISGSNQHIDNHTLVDHQSSFTPSKQLYKGILAGNSTAVFNGKVIARKGTHQVDASQTNRNLLLSEKSRINTKPQLEIFADDLKCSHGATVGQLDKEALFYLTSRGLGINDAQRILTSGFAGEVLDNVSNIEIRDDLSKLVNERLYFESTSGMR